MPKFILSAVFIVFVLSLAPLPAEDPAFFPPAEEAKPFVDWDNAGFLINGERTFIASGSLHYPRVPRVLWRDRLLRMKRGAFNNVQTYLFWNYHEPKENEWDFTGEKDVDAFFKTAQEVGLTATARVGPYVCAEWEFGGYPIWIKFKPRFTVRSEDPTYTELQESWYDKIMPIITAHQINKGGNIIIVQLENEGNRWGAWTGTINDKYYNTLHDSAIKHGVQVPFLMSGTHHGFNPYPENPDPVTRNSPWYSTEVWAGWYDLYGLARGGTNNSTTRFMTKALSYGACGFNFYMLHGGSNFETWNNNEDASTYDYSGGIGQAGDLRPVYYTMKRYNSFATSFSSILCAAHPEDLTRYEPQVANAHVVSARKSPAGTIVFVQGFQKGEEPMTFQGVGEGAAGTIHLDSNEVVGLVLDAPLTPDPNGIKIVQAVSKVYGVAHNGNTTTLILFGKPGDTGTLTLDLAGTKKKIDISYPEGQPNESFEKAGDQTLRLLSMSDAMTDMTWIVGAKGQQSVVVGPEYVGEFANTDGKPSMLIERYFDHAAPSKVLVYGDATQTSSLAVNANTAIDSQPAPEFGPWQVSAAPDEVRPDYNDSAWKTTDDPEQMGADGDTSAFAWYRTVIQATAAGPGTLHFAGANDNILVYLNGQLVPATATAVQPKPDRNRMALTWDASVNLQAGANSLAVFVSHAGRDKAVGYYGPIDDYFSKGIYQAVTLDIGGQKTELKGWKMRGGIMPIPTTFKEIDPAAVLTTPVFYQTSFEAKPLAPDQAGPNPIYRIVTTGLSRGTIFLNGHSLGRYPEVVKVDKVPVPIYMPECWYNADGKNSLVIFDEEGKSPDKVKLVIERESSREVIAVTDPTDAASSLTIAAFKRPTMRGYGPGGTILVDKPATASSSESSHEAYQANDGYWDSFWRAKNKPTPDNPAWIQFDAGSEQSFKTISMTWENKAYQVSYLIEGSTDGTTWKTLVDKREPAKDKKDERDVNASVPDGTSARYIKLTVTDLHDTGSFGLNNIELKK